MMYSHLWRLRVHNGEMILNTGPKNLPGGNIYRPSDEDISFTDDAMYVKLEHVTLECPFKNYDDDNFSTISKLQELNIVKEVKGSILCFLHDLIGSHRAYKKGFTAKNGFTLFDETYYTPENLMEKYSQYKGILQKVDWKHALSLIEVR